ncbi:hypothetical protein Hdeb2414_s0103g00794511 [Helianthus debilis subsp. tardiflorus]
MTNLNRSSPNLSCSQTRRDLGRKMEKPMKKGNKKSMKGRWWVHLTLYRSYPLV